jgi:hypothetical protein
MLNGITAFYNDAAIKQIVRKYYDVAHGGANENIDNKAAAYDLDMTARLNDDPESDPEGYKLRTREFKAEFAKLPAKTYGQRRTELIARLLTRCSELSSSR